MSLPRIGHVLALVLVALGCTPVVPEGQLVCATDDECPSNRRCSAQLCVEGPRVDSGPRDAMMSDGGDDAGESDAGESDAGESDAGETDAGESDAGESDAGEADAGEADAGETDAGEADAGDIDSGAE